MFCLTFFACCACCFLACCFSFVALLVTCCLLNICVFCVSIENVNQHTDGSTSREAIIIWRFSVARVSSFTFLLFFFHCNPSFFNCLFCFFQWRLNILSDMHGELSTAAVFILFSPGEKEKTRTEDPSASEKSRPDNGTQTNKVICVVLFHLLLFSFFSWNKDILI